MSMHSAYFREGRSTHGRRSHLNYFGNRDGNISNISYSDSSSTAAYGPDGGLYSLDVPENGKVRFYNYGDNFTESRSDLHLGAVVHKPDPQKVLTVRKVDLQISENAKAHHTNKFAISSLTTPSPQLVVRRGQLFTIKVEFSRLYDHRADDLKLVFEAGDKPLTSKRTHVEFILSDEDKPLEWGAKLAFLEGSTATIEVFTPPTCFIAKWTLKIDVVKKEDTSIDVYRYVHKNPIYILFNPWCKDDTVYVTESKLLDEYILNETGKIFNGNQTSITFKPWNFGQFESCVLDLAIFLLDSTELNWAVRGNPIPIVRKLSALLNSPDDGGIVTGKWEGDYSGGTPPFTWTGSVAILEKYWKTKRPVNYGQCWVFAGIATTICRALGIPARSVTNFSSAHDTDGSITVDYHLTPDNEMDEKNNYDRVWNFHVWTEVWMARPDLPPGHGGWQVIDATPQENSDGVYCCGPASVTAIQQGEVHLPYDGPFVFAEVNADTVYWQPNELGVMQCLYIDKKGIGKFISTKAPNSDKREDLTLAYKHTEDSAEERATVIKANLVGASQHDIYKPTANDVKFKIEQDSENTWLGGSFIIGLNMKNNSSEKRTVSGRIVVSSMYYTGVTSEKLKSEPFATVVQPGEETVQNVEVTQDEYDGRLKDGCMLDVSILTHVKETDQHFTKKSDYRLHKPHLTARAPAAAVVNEEFLVDVSFVNPLNSTLTQCSITVDGVSRAIRYPQRNLLSYGTFTASLPLVAKKVGNQEIIIVFNSKQLEDINTTCPIFISEA